MGSGVGGCLVALDLSERPGGPLAQVDYREYAAEDGNGRPEGHAGDGECGVPCGLGEGRREGRGHQYRERREPEDEEAIADPGFGALPNGRPIRRMSRSTTVPRQRG